MFSKTIALITGCRGNIVKNKLAMRFQKFCLGSDKSNLANKATNGREIINGISCPEPPTYCCNSGCANCVWIKYAQEITQLFDNGDVIAKNKILENVPDPNLRAFLFTQLGLTEKKE